MGFATYSELKVEIKSWAKRKDIEDKIDGFIKLTEAEIWQRLRMKEMEDTTTGTTSTSNRYMALPADYITYKSLRILVDGIYTNPLKNVDQLGLYLRDHTGIPCHFAINETLEFDCVSDQAYTVEFVYVKKLTGLSSANATNAILSKYPMVYLAGCMKQFSVWALNDEKIQFWENKFDIAMADANSLERRGRYPAPSVRIPGMVV